MSYSAIHLCTGSSIFNLPSITDICLFNLCNNNTMLYNNTIKGVPINMTCAWHLKIIFFLYHDLSFSFSIWQPIKKIFFISLFSWGFFQIFYYRFLSFLIVRTVEGQSRPKYIFNKMWKLRCLKISNPTIWVPMNDERPFPKRQFPKVMFPSGNLLRLCSQVATSQTVHLSKSDPAATLCPHCSLKRPFRTFFQAHSL